MKTRELSIDPFPSRKTDPTLPAGRLLSHGGALALATILLCVLQAFVPSRAFGLAISPGSDTTGSLGDLANDIVQLSDPGGLGSGTIVQVTNFNGGEDIDVLTADHVVRNDSGNGSALFAPGQITMTFGNTGAGGASFAAEAVATDFTIPTGGGSAVDLAMVDIFVPGSQLNTLPAGLTGVGLPKNAPGVNSAIIQAGYGLSATVTNVSGVLAYANSTVWGWGSGFGTLRSGSNTVGSAGVININGALSGYSNNTGFVQYSYRGFRNGALINGSSPNYNGSTSYIFSGDSGGPSLSGNTILGVHSSSVTGTLVSDTNAQVALSGNTNYYWSDVSVYDNLTWIDTELATLSIPEPAPAALVTVSGALALFCQRRFQMLRRRPRSAKPRRA
jgi:hypothetical protein